MIKPIVLAIFILLAGLIIIFQTSRIAGAFLFETNEFTLYDENDNIVDCKFFINTIASSGAKTNQLIIYFPNEPTYKMYSLLISEKIGGLNNYGYGYWQSGRFLFLSTKALNFNIDIELLSTPLSNSENIFAEIKPGENLEHLGESLIIKKNKISSNSN